MKKIYEEEIGIEVKEDGKKEEVLDGEINIEKEKDIDEKIKVLNLEIVKYAFDTYFSGGNVETEKKELIVKTSAYLLDKKIGIDVVERKLENFEKIRTPDELMKIIKIAKEVYVKIEEVKEKEEEKIQEKVDEEIEAIFLETETENNIREERG